MSSSTPKVTALDGDKRTLHVRCGSDLEEPLKEAGFQGDFYEHSYPYLIGPVREGDGCLAQRAAFLVDTYGNDRNPPLDFEATLRALEEAERTLHESARYERVVVWSEGDCYDQLVLLRLLGHYARYERPPQLELINVGEFPGVVPFIGLGQLRPDDLRTLWPARREATSEQLSLGLDAWLALASPDPRALAAILRTGTPALPLLAPALHRHLRELPSFETGLSFTEAMALTLLAEQPHSLQQIFKRMTYELDPLPGQGDFQVRDRILAMERATAPVFTRAPGVDRDGNARPPWTDVLTLTQLGRAVLCGEVDFRSLDPPARWVGGVPIGADHADWRWDDARRDAVTPQTLGRSAN